MTQQEFLKDLKEKTGLTWDAIAAASGVSARALKTYRMPESSKDYRPMPNVAKVALTSILK